MRRTAPVAQVWLLSFIVPTTFIAGVSAVVESDSQSEQAGQVAMRAADALMYEAKIAGRDRRPMDAWMSSCCLLVCWFQAVAWSG